MRRLNFTLFFLAILLLVPLANAAEDEPRRTVSVTGEGKTSAPPDMAVIQTGVVTYGKTAADAMASNNETMEKVLGVLKAHEIPPKDVQSSRFTVDPEYERDEQGRRQPEIVGYTMTNQVRVEVHKLENLGKVLDALVRAGSNQISGIRFGIDDPTSVLNQARTLAVEDARMRAELYAEAAGVRLGRLLTISEQGVDVPRPRYLGRGLVEKAASSVPVATGEEVYRARIHMVFALEGI